MRLMRLLMTGFVVLFSLSHAFAAQVSTPFAWIANAGGASVSKLNATDGSNNGTFSVGSTPLGLAVDASGSVWVANRDHGTVSRLNASNGSVIATITIGAMDGSAGVAIDSSGNVWVANNYADTVTKITASNNSVASTVSVGNGPNGIVYSSGSLWVANWNDNSVSRINASTGSVSGTYSVGTNPYFVAADASGNIWVTNYGSNNVSVLNGSDGNLIGKYATGTTPRGVAVDGYGVAWVVNGGDNTVSKRYVSNGSVIGTYSVGSDPSGIAVDSSGNVWVTNYASDSVSKLNGSTGALIGTYSVGNHPVSIGDYTGFALQYFVLGYSLPDTAPPGINFTSPTPTNGTNQSATNVEINVSIVEQNLENLTYDWNGTNYTMYNDSLILMMNFDNVSALGEAYNNSNGSIIVDVSNAGNNGTLYSGAAGDIIYNLTGRYGGAFEFDGVDDYIDCGSSLDIGGAVTYSFWIKPKEFEANQAIISNLGTDAGDFYLLISSTNGNLYLRRWTGVGTNYKRWMTTENLTFNEWNHVLIDYDDTSDTMNFYINGIPSSTSTFTSSIDQSSSNFLVGKFEVSPKFNGSIDELRIWNRSLSASEVYQQYISNLRKYDTNKWYLYVNQGKNATAGLDDGTYAYQAFATDTSGNSNSTEQRTITIRSDATPPQINFTSPTPTNGTNQSATNVEINVSIVEQDLANLTYNWNGTNYTLYADDLAVFYSGNDTNDTVYINPFKGSPNQWQKQNLTEGLVLAMTFNNNSLFGENSMLVSDLSGNKNDGNVSGAVWNSSGKYGGAYSFDGNDDYINVSNANSLNITNALTIAAWIKLGGLDSWMGIVSKGSGFRLAVSSVNKINTNINGYTCGDSGVVQANVWVHVATTYTNSTDLVKIYINGVENSSVDRSASFNSINPVSNPLQIGVYDSNSFNGTIDDVRVWNRGLSATEVYQVYNSSLPKFNPTQWYLYVNQTKNSTTGLTDGTYTFQAFAVDTSGNSNQTGQRILTVDATAPVVRLAAPGNNTAWTASSMVNFTYNVTDDSSISYCNLSIGGVVNQSNTTITKNVNHSFNVSMVNGVYNWSVNCTDALGNNGFSGLFSANVVTPFSVLANSPANQSATADSTPDFNFTVNSSGSYSCELLINDSGYGVNSSVSGNVSTVVAVNSSLWNGTFYWRVNCTIGGIGNSSELRTLIVDTVQPAIWNVTVSATPVLVNASVGLSANVSDNVDISLVWASVSVPGGVVNLTLSLSGGLYAGVFTNASSQGLYNVSLYVNDSAGNLNNSNVSFTVSSCIVDSDCSADGFFGNSYCFNNDVYRMYRDYSCTGGGTTASSCGYSDVDRLADECGDSAVVVGSEYCLNNIVVRDITSVVRGCDSSTVSCFARPSQMTETVEVCAESYTCSGGSCIGGGAATTTTTLPDTTTTTRSTSTTTSHASTTTASASTTSTTIAACLLPGDFPPCGVVTLSEAVSYIYLWAQGEADLSDVINLINAWQGE